MTIVVYRDGKIAADSAGWRGDCKVGSFRKITRTRAGFLAGAAGEAGCIQRFLRWAEDGCPEGKLPELEKDGFDGFTVSPLGVITGYSHSMLPFVVVSPFYGEGCGYPVALGALAAGASAETAAQIACDHADGCRGPVIVEAL